jgi:Mg-chelatase subunit ChlD
MVQVQPLLFPTATRQQAVRAFAVSTVVHASLLVGLALIGVSLANGSLEPGIDAAFNDRADTTELSKLATVSLEPSTRAESSARVAAGVGSGTASGHRVPAMIDTGFKLTLANAGGGNRGVGFDPIGDDDLRELTSKTTSGANFFGVTAGGDEFVFVVDISGSMNEEGRFRRAKGELKRSIQALAQTQKYYVVFFNHGALPMNSKELLPATTKNILETIRWMNSLQPDGGTNPGPALSIGLDLKPDAVFLLSDGIFDPAIVDELARFTRSDEKPIPIHTIAFVSRIGEPLLQAISRITRGTFKFVR